MYRSNISRFRINIDSSNFFEVDSFKLNEQRFCDIRSISGYIGGDFDKTILSDTIKNYLRFQNNVELINILSRELNKENYFECYIQNSNQSDLEIKQRILNDSEVAWNHASLYSQDLQDNHNQFIPNKLKDVCKYTLHIKRNIFDFYPIWYINGKTNDPSCELLCHFDIVIHILANKFVEFKAKILRLAATDIEIAIHENNTIEDYAKMRKQQLLLTLKQRDERIEKLIILNEEANRKLDDLKEDNKITHEKLDDLKESHREMRDAIVEYTSSLVKYSEEKIPASNITTGSTHEVLIVFFKQETSDHLREAIEIRNMTSKVKIEIEDDDLIYDTIVVRDDKEDEELKKHEFDSSVDRIIFKGYCNNSMDLFKHFNEHIGNIGRVINMKRRCSRKIISKAVNEKQLHDKLQLYANRSLNIKQGLLSLMKFGTETMISHINNKLGESIHEEITILKEAIDKNTEAVNKNTELMNDILSKFNELHPDAEKVFFNHAYRDIIIENGKVMCRILKDSEKLHELTMQEIQKLKFL